LRDRLARGLAAGLAGGVAMNVFNLISYYLGVAELRFLDWSALVIYGVKPLSVAEAVFAQLAQLFLVGFLGVVFAYLIPMISSVNLLLRGWLYGSMIWFLLYGISMLFKLKGTIPLYLDTAASDFVCASIYGLVMAEVLRYFDQKVKEKE